jgi:hypothetical protein
LVRLLPLEPVLRLRLDELVPLREPVDRFDAPERLRDELDRLFVAEGLLFDPVDRALERVRFPVLPASPLCPSSPPSSPFPSSFFATPTAAGTATPMAAPAATFLPVDIPSFSSSI